MFIGVALCDYNCIGTNTYRVCLAKSLPITCSDLRQILDHTTFHVVSIGNLCKLDITEVKDGSQNPKNGVNLVGSKSQQLKGRQNFSKVPNVGLE